MGIRRYMASKDTSITNAYRENLTTRATDANMGASDSLEVFSLYNQAGEQEKELSRILVQFPIEEIKNDRGNNKIPLIGDVQFILKMSNVAHPNTTPKQYELLVNPLSRSWEEGSGLDMERYLDTGYSNWVSASSTQAWDNEGGDIHTSPQYIQYFETGTEDIEIDITNLVEKWIDDTIENNGIMIKMSSSLEEDTKSYYTKKFSSRGSEFFYKKPWIEARYDATIKDDRGNFYLYNPYVGQEYSYNNLYIYNMFKGNLYDLPTVGMGEIYVSLHASPNLPFDNPLPLIDGETVATGSWVSKGIYKVSLGINTELQKVYDVWSDSNGDVLGVGGEVNIINPDGTEVFTKKDYVMSIKNLKSSYSTKEEPRIHTFVREKNWNPNVYTSVVSTPFATIMDEMYYKIYRVVDNLDVIPYGTGSMNHTRLSYDKNGNYFDLDVSLLEPGYTYGIKFLIFDVEEYHESRETFKFRVE